MGSDVLAHLDRIAVELYELSLVPPAELPSCVRSEALVAVEGLSSRLDEVKLSITGAWDAAADWAYEGALSGAAWLRANVAVTGAAAGWQVRTARALLAAPVLAERYRVGDLATAKVRLLAPLALGETASLFARDEQMLVDQAIGLTTAGLPRAARYWQAGPVKLFV
jgi:hypothetical protein